MRVPKAVVREGHGITKRLIIKHGLALASERDLLPVLSDSCIALGYTHGMRRFLPFTYGAVAAIVDQDRTRFLLNEERVADGVGRLLRKIGGRKFIQTVITPAYRSGLGAIQTIETLASGTGAAVRLKKILAAYEQFMAAIGVFNCLNRFAMRKALPFPAATVRQIANQRERIGGAYPIIERHIGRLVRILGRDFGFDGDLLRYMTVSEIEEFMVRRCLSASDLRTLRKRRSRCLLFTDETRAKILVSINGRNVRVIERQSSRAERRQSVLQGQPAFPGTVRGVVYRPAVARRRPSAKSVLVVSMTHPKDTSLIKKCAAIVTNEGGILSHAAVIAREFRIPCIIGTKVATQVLKHGDRVEVDAERGVVRKL